MYDSNGKEYIDMVSGVSVSNVGHQHPKVVQAIKEQLDKYMHLMVYGEFIQNPQVQLAKKLTDYLPPHLDSVYFVNSGSEAIEGALKLAKRYTGKTEIIAFKRQLSHLNGLCFLYLSEKNNEVYFLKYLRFWNHDCFGEHRFRRWASGRLRWH